MFRNDQTRHFDLTFMNGYPYENKYHNVGQLQTPYKNKYFGTGGDYGPPQATHYYTHENSNYPYVLDEDFRPEEYLPTEGLPYSKDEAGNLVFNTKNLPYRRCYENNHPQYYVPGNYFSSRWKTTLDVDPTKNYANNTSRGYCACPGGKRENYMKLPVANEVISMPKNFKKQNFAV